MRKTESILFTIKTHSRLEFSNIRWAVDDITTDEAFIVFDFEKGIIKIELYDSNDFTMRFHDSNKRITVALADAFLTLTNSDLKIKKGTLSIDEPSKTPTTQKLKLLILWDDILKAYFDDDSDKVNELGLQLESQMPFATAKEQQRWNDAFIGFTDYRTIDEMTFNIINRINN